MEHQGPWGTRLAARRPWGGIVPASGAGLRPKIRRAGIALLCALARRGARRAAHPAPTAPAAVLLAGLALLAGAPVQAQADPQDVVRLLYQHYVEAPDSLVFAFDYADPNVAPNYFDPALTRLIVADAKDDEPRLDFDPFVGGHDFEITGLDLQTRMISDAKAEVVARFRNFDEDTIMTFSVVRTARGWRIADVRGADADASLKALLSAPRQ